MNEGRECMEMNSICEKVSAEPGGPVSVANIRIADNVLANVRVHKQ